MQETNEQNTITPTFTDDDWKAIFGSENEVDDDVKEGEPSQISEPKMEEKPRQNDEPDNSAQLISAVNNLEMPTVNSSQIVCSSTNSTESVGNSEVLSASVVPEVQDARVTLSMVVMDLCMKREQKLRVEGNIVEANALSAVGFSVMNLLGKVMELLRSNECIRIGSLILEAAKGLMNKGSDEWESLILCTESIHALVDEIRIKTADLNNVKQLGVNKTEMQLNKKEHIMKLANKRKRRKLEAIYGRKQEEANGKRKRHMMQRTESHSILHPPITHQASVEASSVSTKEGGENAILIMAANKFRIRKEERQRQVKKESQINENRECLPQSNEKSECLSQSNVSDRNLKVMPNLLDDKSFTGPISAEALMEECEEPDSINSLTLPSFPVCSMQGDANHNCLQRSDAFTLSSEGEPPKFHTSSHIRSDLPTIGEIDCSRLIDDIQNQSATLSCPSVPVKSDPFGTTQLISLTSATSPIRPESVTQPAQKYRNLNFVKIRKADAKLNKSASENPPSKKKNMRLSAMLNSGMCFRVIFAAESKYSVIELPDDPNATTDVVNIIGFRRYRKKYPRGSANMPVLEPNILRPIGDINARSFCESCEFTRGNIRNWLIVGSRFDRLDERVFDIKKSGCPKTHISYANYPPIHFRILCDALTNIFIKVGGLKFFLAIGEDWIVKKSIMPEEFTSFIDVLYKLYARQYKVEHAKKIEFTEDLEKSSDSETEAKCDSYNNAIQELVQNWDATWRSPYYHNATRQSIELKLIDWRQLCINENANSSNNMITVLMKHLVAEWGVCMTPTNRF
uniref:C2H2-type domain-containing protein n=1 Tax=Elaeophora elaphi TaxID=1147741 RepID=A0A0R3S1G3_9BILA